MKSESKSSVVDEPKNVDELSLFNFCFSFQIPLNENEEKEYEMKGGSLKSDLSGDSASMEEGGDVCIVFPETNSRKRFFISKEGMVLFEKKCVKLDTVVLKFSRYIKVDKKKDNPNWEDFNKKKYEGCIEINVESFMEPGVKKIEGWFDILNEIEKVDVSLDENEEKQERNVQKKVVKKKNVKKLSKIPNELLPEENDIKFPFNEAKTKVFISLSLREPIIVLPKNRKRTKISISTLIPARKELKKKICEDEVFRNEVKNVVLIIIEEYHKFLAQNRVDIKNIIEESVEREFINRKIAMEVPDKKDELKNEKNSDQKKIHQKKISEKLDKKVEDVKLIDKLETKEDEMRLKAKIRKEITENFIETEEDLKKKFIFFLNNSGCYFSFKEQLKKSVQTIIKSRFSKDLSESSDFTRNKLFNDIYVFLVKQMYVVINSFFDETISQDDLQLDSNIKGNYVVKLLKYCKEAVVEKNLPLAHKCFKERISYNPNDSDLYFDYGRFCFQNNMYEDSEKMLKESLKHNMCHVKTLLCYGTLLCVQEKYEESEVFFQAVVDLDENNLLGWLLLSMYYSCIENEKQKHQCYLYAERIFKTKKLKKSLRIILVEYLLDLNVHTLTERILLEEKQEIAQKDEKKVSNESNDNLEYYFAKMYYIRENYTQAEESLDSVVVSNHKFVPGWTLFGHVYYAQNKITKAQQSYERAVSISKEDTDALLLIRLAEMYLAQEKYEDAKITFLDATKIWSCGITWLGVGISYYRLNDIVNAEQALNEANIQNNINPIIWGYLVFICLRKEREKEADRCLREAKKNKIEDSRKGREILTEIREMYVKKKRESEYVNIME